MQTSSADPMRAGRTFEGTCAALTGRLPAADSGHTDKGKPVARRGRKATGLPSGVSRATEERSGLHGLPPRLIQARSCAALKGCVSGTDSSPVEHASATRAPARGANTLMVMALAEAVAVASMAANDASWDPPVLGALLAFAVVSDL